MSTSVATADQRLRNRLDTTATGSTWGTETIDYLSQAQRQVVTDLHDSMFSDGNLTGMKENEVTTAPVSGEAEGAAEFDRATDSIHVVAVYHTRSNVTRGMKRLDSPDQVYNIASLSAGYESTARPRLVYALQLSKLVAHPAKVGDVITEKYIKIPTALTATTNTFQVPDWLVDTVITYTLYLCLTQVDKWAGAAAAAMAEYKMQIAGWYRRFKLEPPPQFLPVPSQEKA